MQSRKEVIKNCAAKLFRKKGFKATSMRDIAEEVGIKAASIYNHIDSKHQLLEELLLSIAYLFTKGMKDINHASINTESKLDRLVSLHIRLTVEHTDAIALIVREWIHLKEPAKQKYIQLRDDYENDFKAILESCLLYTSPSPRDATLSRMPSSA